MKITASHQGNEVVRTIANETVLIGRGDGPGAPDLDLSPDGCVSRKHALLTEHDGAVWIRDLGSKLGTAVNGQLIPHPGEWRLQPGDAVQVGETILRVELSSFASPPPHVRIAANESPGKAEFQIVLAVDAGACGAAFIPSSRPGVEWEHRLRFFVDLSAQLGLPVPVDALLSLVLRGVMELIPAAERGAALLRGADDRELRVRACVSPDGPAVSGTLARRAMLEGRGFIWRHHTAERLPESVVDHRIATGIYAPLQWRDETLGVLCVDTPRIAAVFNSDDLRVLMAVAQYTALALKARQAGE